MKTFLWPATSIDTTGLATEAKQDVQIGLETSMDAHLAQIETDLSSVAGTDFATEAKQDVQIGLETTMDANLALLTQSQAATGGAQPSKAQLIAGRTTGSILTPLLTNAGGQLVVDASQFTLPVQITSYSRTNVSGSASALNADAVAATEIVAGTGLSVQITGTWSGVLAFQGSNDLTNFVSIPALEVSNLSGLPISSTSSNGIFFIHSNFRYIRIRMTSYTSGTATATGFTYEAPVHDSNARNVSVVNQPSGLATETTLLDVDSQLVSVNTELDSLSTQVANIKAGIIMSVQDQIDSPNQLLDTSSINIPASSGSPLEVVASLASTIYKITSVEDIGSFIGLYTGPSSSEVLYGVLPLGGGDLTVNIAAGTRISLRAMENVAINSGKIALNFIGG